MQSFDIICITTIIDVAQSNSASVFAGNRKKFIEVVKLYGKAENFTWKALDLLTNPTNSYYRNCPSLKFIFKENLKTCTKILFWKRPCLHSLVATTKKLCRIATRHFDFSLAIFSIVFLYYYYPKDYYYYISSCSVFFLVHVGFVCKRKRGDWAHLFDSFSILSVFVFWLLRCHQRHTFAESCDVPYLAFRRMLCFFSLCTLHKPQPYITSMQRRKNNACFLQRNEKSKKAKDP